ncbi:hypothetical protein A2331_06430 [Candidatus Falkowbacteria bacterium RIFOXYB2_FULL_34_18]|uniref:Uncharacterized protein n=1 Tax=Candidatus Falkowbacteria bacterium RIFOXYD2_FULL_34_120 TaxID=1798007 RepID=A0A1F5TQ11_9BACT|nr:MAG: hypothetical protein A2331_06430 [Candidatus Falkowbacteria bacterium RIFOXYB2_FULL_34_18]OGF29405.1 MAG: hypothetical protein A2500_06520 [Candidatus Falkowbacteria bacterium RIFOXYC12_FULL_34_55]OGF36614.1 MAG: hypothetical protein A2466_06855 [Candidatus Falkowbacteria bacterium RIFOXYC2_FULL_34_220]OGF38832.1 MAG: hypothetical protein A2515_03300 [Candidatus Falkowbacteria bacterium RIFOXYD12_FULL_34_57]OGF41063.1 MAG: hypothetical protein A2531_03195 [Candidatus Falkowbacteria bact
MLQIKLNKNLYKLKAVNAAIKEFKNLADFEIIKEKDKYLINLSNIKNEARNKVCDEFCNFVLYLMNKN